MSLFTHAHHQKIIAHLRGVKPYSSAVAYTDYLDQWEASVESLADLFTRDNPDFNRAAFYHDCTSTMNPNF